MWSGPRTVTDGLLPAFRRVRRFCSSISMGARIPFGKEHFVLSFPRRTAAVWRWPAKPRIAMSGESTIFDRAVRGDYVLFKLWDRDRRRVNALREVPAGYAGPLAESL